MKKWSKVVFRNRGALGSETGGHSETRDSIAPTPDCEQKLGGRIHRLFKGYSRARATGRSWASSPRSQSSSRTKWPERTLQVIMGSTIWPNFLACCLRQQDGLAIKIAIGRVMLIGFERYQDQPPLRGGQGGEVSVTMVTGHGKHSIWNN